MILFTFRLEQNKCLDVGEACPSDNMFEYIYICECFYAKRLFVDMLTKQQK